MKFTPPSFRTFYEMSKDYAIEKFYVAILSLIGMGDIRERLESAALTLSTLRPGDDFPTSLRERFKSLWSDLTREEAQIEGEGRIRATIRKIEPEDAAKIAEQIFDLYFDLLDITPFGHRRE
jgi:hypothetical protein